MATHGLKTGIFILLLLTAALFSQTNIAINTSSTITSVFPAADEIDVPASTSIRAVFNSDSILSSSVNENTFLVFGSATGLRNGNVAYNSSNHTASFNPSNDFLPGETVTAILSDGIRTKSGNKLTNGFQWNFSIRSQTGNKKFSYKNIKNIFIRFFTS